MIVCGIDPTSGTDSGLGIAAFDTEKLKIVYANVVFCPKQFKKTLHYRIRYLTDYLSDEIDYINPSQVYIESTVMRGKGGESLARATGALMSAVPMQIKLDFVHNTTVKKIVGGSGRAEKDEVAEGLLRFFKEDQASVFDLETLIQTKNWDSLDALAIAVAGHLGGAKKK